MGGQPVTVRPMALGPLMELLLLLGPYLVLVDSYLPAVQDGLKENDQDLLFQVFKTLSERMTEFPGDMVKMIGLMTDLPPDRIAKEATPAEIVAALPVLDRVHRFRDLVDLAGELGSGHLLNNGS